MWGTLEYKGWKIIYNPKPIPTSMYDYDVVHEDYDGAPDSDDCRYFTTESIDIAKELIDSWEDD